MSECRWHANLELGNDVITRSGWTMEVYRADWPIAGPMAWQVKWDQLNPGGVTETGISNG